MVRLIILILFPTISSLALASENIYKYKNRVHYLVLSKPAGEYLAIQEEKMEAREILLYKHNDVISYVTEMEFKNPYILKISNDIKGYFIVNLKYDSVVSFCSVHK